MKQANVIMPTDIVGSLREMNEIYDCCYLEKVGKGKEDCKKMVNKSIFFKIIAYIFFIYAMIFVVVSIP